VEDFRQEWKPAVHWFHASRSFVVDQTAANDDHRWKRKSEAAM
jgi:hypothetical protein